MVWSSAARVIAETQGRESVGDRVRRERARAIVRRRLLARQRELHVFNAYGWGRLGPI